APRRARQARSLLRRASSSRGPIRVGGDPARSLRAARRREVRARRAHDVAIARSLAGVPLIGWRTSGEPERWLRGHVPDLNVVFRTEDNGTLTALVAEGLGAAVVPRLVVNPRNPAVVSLPLGSRIPARTLAVAWHRDRYRSAAARAFTELALRLGAE